jgi:hypothetical protein
MQPIRLVVAWVWVRLTALESLAGRHLPPGTAPGYILRVDFLLYFCWWYLLRDADGHRSGYVCVPHVYSTPHVLISCRSRRSSACRSAVNAAMAPIPNATPGSDGFSTIVSPSFSAESEDLRSGLARVISSRLLFSLCRASNYLGPGYSHAAASVPVPPN